MGVLESESPEFGIGQVITTDLERDHKIGATRMFIILKGGRGNGRKYSHAREGLWIQLSSVRESVQHSTGHLKSEGYTKAPKSQRCHITTTIPQYIKRSS